MLRSPVYAKVVRTAWTVLFIAIVAAILLLALNLHLPNGSTAESMLVFMQQLGGALS